MDILDGFNLTEDQKKQINEAWDKLRIAGLSPDLFVIARILDPTFNWGEAQEKLCESCQRTESDK